MARGEQVKAVVSAPPRHGKTETELHAIAWLLARKPSLQLAFVGYAARFADKKSFKARELAKRAGVPISDSSSAKQDWRTGIEDGGVWATSIGGQVTGEGFHLMLVDDPVKDRATAESAAQRDATYDWFTDTAYTRLEPNGSCIVTQTRWHEDDLAGRLIAEGWENVCLPAINDEGEALWPERFSAEQLADIRRQLGEYGWWSLYQGKPRPRGGAVFGQPATFTTPPTMMRVAIGIDFAYTAKTHADYSVAVVVGESGGKLYVLEVAREQVAAPQFATTLRGLRSRYPHARLVSYVGGTEKGVVDLLNRPDRDPFTGVERPGLRIESKPAKADKFVRAQATAASWNADPPRIGVREGTAWGPAFMDEVCGFSGVGDKHDDQVDALVAAHDALMRAPIVVTHDQYDDMLPRLRA